MFQRSGESYQQEALVAFSLRDLRAMSDEELVKYHDKVAQNTTTSLDYYREELVRRENTRQNEYTTRMTEEMRNMTSAMLRATKVMAWLTVFITLLTIANLILVGISLRH
jgi:hypothetical protein